MDLEQIWKASLGELEVRLSHANFGTWFSTVYISDFKHDTVYLASHNAFTRDWIKRKYEKDIFLTLKKFIPSALKVEFIVASKSEAPPRVISAPQRKPSATAEAKSQSSLGAQYTFDKFVVGTTNKFAHAAATAVAEKPGELHNPLFIYGGVGLGKTHLAQAIGNEILRRDSSKKVVFVPCETFTNDFVTSISSGKMKEFKKSYRDIDVLIIDDIQFLANKEGSQEEFFHTYNTLHQTNRQIVTTADRPPKDIKALEERLKSRLGSGLLTDIQAPDLETRIAILNNKAEQTKVNFNDDVILYIAEKIHSNVRILTGAMHKITTHAYLYKEDPTVALCDELLQDMFTPVNDNTSVDKVMNAISRYYNLTIADILAQKRDKMMVQARQVAMYLMRHELGLPFSLVGKELGDRNHSTCMHGAKVIEKGIIKDPVLRRNVISIKERIHSN